MTDSPASHEVTRILNAMGEKDPRSTNALIPLIYQELRRLAAYKLAGERSGQTLQPTALVHEAYLRLVKPKVQTWNSRRHFFSAASEAMRRILIETARRKRALKRGGKRVRTFLDVDKLPIEKDSFDLIDLNVALERLEASDPDAAELVKLRFFVGLTMKQIAQLLDISERQARNIWSFSKAWLYQRLKEEG